MAILQLWSLEQSILGSGNKNRQNVSLDRLIEWSRSEPTELVPQLVWRTELALVYLNVPIGHHNHFLKSVFKGLGFSARDYVTTDMRLEFGTVPLDTINNANNSKSSGKRSFRIKDRYSGLLWFWDPARRLTRGIIYGCLRYYPVEAKMYYTLTSIQRHHDLRTNPLLLGFALLSSESRYCKISLDYWSKGLDELQKRTGRHSFIDRDRVLDKSGIDWVKASSDASGTAVGLSIIVWRMETFLNLIDFIVDQSCAPTTGRSELFLRRAGLSKSLIASRVQISTLAQQWRLQAQSFLNEAGCFHSNAETLVQTIFTLTAQRDQQISIEIARDSKTLAEQATKDSTSMKAIAAVTMFFLPGTFVASFFAMPLFAWELESGQSISDQFWVYWAVTLPLTVVVIIIWIIWSYRTELARWMRGSKSRHADLEDDEAAECEHEQSGDAEQRA